MENEIKDIVSEGQISAISLKEFNLPASFRQISFCPVQHLPGYILPVVVAVGGEIGRIAPSTDSGFQDFIALPDI